jgi:membrane associated rhomboid family serine protease
VAGAAPGAAPLVVPVLVALNVVMFAWTAIQAASVSANYTAPIFREWALRPDLVADGEWWRIITSGFLHVGPLHLAFNMLALWIIGRDVETILGRGRLLAVYLVSLLGGSATVMLFQPESQVAGASGAVFGLMGALAVVLRRMRIPAGQVIGLIAVNIVISVLLPNISLVAHLGGLAVGAVATAALVYAPRHNRTAVQAVALAGLTLLLLALVALAGVFI